MTRSVRCTVISEDEYRTNIVDYGPYKINILAEGDSWFSVNGRRANNLLMALATPAPALIVNFAHPGDLIKKITRITRKSYLRRILLGSTRTEWDLIFLSGGGNDLIDNLSKITRPASPSKSPTDPRSWIDQTALNNTAAEVADAFRKFASFRDGTAHHDIPILVHTYDYATPRNISRSFFGVRLGPWMHPVYRKLNVPMGMRPIINDYLVNKIADTLLDLQHGISQPPIRKFFVCDTRGVLTPASSDPSHASADWWDEIHPSERGYEKLANARVNAALEAALALSPRIGAGSSIPMWSPRQSTLQPSRVRVRKGQSKDVPAPPSGASEPQRSSHATRTP